MATKMRKPFRPIPPWRRKINSGLETVSTVLAALGIGAGCLVGCLLFMVIRVGLSLLLGYLVYLACINSFGLVYPWPQILGCGVAIASIFSGGTIQLNKGT